MRSAVAAPFAQGVISADDLCRAVRTHAAAASAAWTHGLDRVLRHDAEQGQLEVQAGVSWAALAGVLGTELLPGTVGQGLAENLPGPDGLPLVAHLRSLTMATPDGQLRRASRERAPELFRLAVGGFGAFGPFYSLTLDLESLARAREGLVQPVRLPLPPVGPSAARHVLDLLLPPACADVVAGRVRDAIAERRCTLAWFEARRALPEEVTLLRWARRDYVALRVEYRARATLGAGVAAAQLRTCLIDLSIDAGGSFMPALLPFATRAQAEACYPMLGEFLAEKRRLDPEDRIGTAWGRAVGRVWRAERCRVRFGRA